MWKEIEGYEMYQVSDMGVVRRFKNGKGCYMELKPFQRGEKKRDDRGQYQSVKLCRDGNEKTIPVHRLVAKAFVPNPKNLPFVNHKNGIKNDNRAENLEWVTASYNTWHSYHVLGNKNIPNDSPKVLQFDKNGNFMKEYESISEAEKETGVNGSSISSVCLMKRKSAGNCIWRYKGRNDDNVSFEDSRPIKVAVISKYGELVKIFDSIVEASKFVGVKCSSNITRCCKEDVKSFSVKGYMFRLLSQYNDEFKPYLNARFLGYDGYSKELKEDLLGTRALVDKGYTLKKVLDNIKGKTKTSKRLIWKVEFNNDIKHE